MMRVAQTKTRFAIVAIALLLAGACSEEEGGPGPGDVVPPGDVTDLAVSSSTDTSATLTWTAPGDDGDTGQASTYDLRYASGTITTANWDAATQIGNEPSPQTAGGTETLTITWPASRAQYFFCLRTADEVPNWSGLSNVVQADLPAVVTLQSVYEAAGPGEGYDKLIVLDPQTVYHGGFTTQGLRCGIHGNGACIDLRGEEILATHTVGDTTVLDIDHCVVMNGLNGINYDGDFQDVFGTVLNNTFYGNGNGIRVFYTGPGVVIKNNIIVSNANYGIYAKQYYEPEILYNDVWDNVGGAYIEQCG